MKINRRLAFFLIIAVIFIMLFVRYQHRAPRRNYSDFRMVYATATRFAQKENIYSWPVPEITPYKYSPMVAMLLSPLSVFSQKIASLIFFTANFILLILIFIISGKIVVENGISKRQIILLYILTAISGSRFILHTLDSGQVGILTLVSLVSGLYFLKKKKEVIAAAFMAFGTIFKYTPLLFLPYFVARKKIKIAVLVALFIIVYFLTPVLYVGIDNEITYLKSWFPFITSTSFDYGTLYDNKNQSFYSVFLRYFTRESPYRISIANLPFSQGLSVAFIAGIILYLLIILRKQSSNFSKCIDYSLLLISAALFNPLGWMHNYIVSLFAYMTLFYYLIKTGFKDKITLFLVILTFAIMTCTNEMFIGDNLETLFEQLSSITVGALILMVSLFRLKFLQQDVG